MALAASLGARINVNLNLLTGFVEIFQKKEPMKNQEPLSLNRKEFVKCAVEEDTVSAQQVASMLKAKIKGLKGDGFAIIFCSYGLSAASRSGEKQVGQVLKTSTAVQTYAGSNGCASE